MAFLDGIIFAHHPSGDSKARALESTSDDVLVEVETWEVGSVDEVPAGTTDTAEDNLTSRFQEAAQVPDGSRVGFRKAGRGFETQAGKDDVEDLPVLLGEHSRIQDVAWYDFPDGVPVPT